MLLLILHSSASTTMSFCARLDTFKALITSYYFWTKKQSITLAITTIWKWLSESHIQRVAQQRRTESMLFEPLPASYLRIFQSIHTHALSRNLHTYNSQVELAWAVTLTVQCFINKTQSPPALSLQAILVARKISIIFSVCLVLP